MRSHVLSGAVAAALAAGPALAQTIEMPTPYADGNFMTENAQALATEAERIAGGDLDIVIRSGGEMVPGPEIYDAVKSGKVVVGQVLLSNLEVVHPVFEADGLPFTARGYDEARKLWAQSRRVYNEALEGEGVSILYAVPWPPQGLFTKQEIKRLRDLEDLKVRTYSPTTTAMASELGAMPVQMEISEVPAAFADGRIDAMFTSATTGVELGAWDFATHYYSTQSTFPKVAVIVNTKAFQELPEKSRTAILNAAQAVELEGWKLSEEKAAADRATLEQKGVVVTAPNDKTFSGAKEVAQTIHADWRQRAGKYSDNLKYYFTSN